MNENVKYALEDWNKKRFTVINNHIEECKVTWCRADIKQ